VSTKDRGKAIHFAVAFLVKQGIDPDRALHEER
jgi:hypothetical protein